MKYIVALLSVFIFSPMSVAKASMYSEFNCDQLIRELISLNTDRDSRMFEKIKKYHLDIFGEFDPFKIKKILNENPDYEFPLNFYNVLGGYYLNLIIKTGRIKSEISVINLIENGVEIEAPDITGQVPLTNSILMGNLEFISLLKKNEFFNSVTMKSNLEINTVFQIDLNT